MASVPTQVSLPVKFHPPKSFRFPKQKFGTKTERLFRAEWCGGVRTIIIHGSTGYDIGTNLAFCHLCMIARGVRNVAVISYACPVIPV